MEQTEHKKPIHWIWYIIGMIALFVLIAFIARLGYATNYYTRAKESAFSGDYATAMLYLDKLDSYDYRKAEPLMYYCEARQAYASGDISEAHFDMIGTYFNDLTDEQQAEVDDFEATLDKEYDIYMEEKAKKAAQEEALRIRNGVPFVGMSESDISHTSLGSPSSDVGHNYECIGGQQYIANIYDFYSGKKRIYSARCVRGRVTEVWDDRDRDYYVPSYSGHTTSSSDPYDVDDYVHPDDFYYDHYNDFFDYEDAEDYYNEHHK